MRNKGMRNRECCIYTEGGGGGGPHTVTLIPLITLINVPFGVLLSEVMEPAGDLRIQPDPKIIIYCSIFPPFLPLLFH